MNEGKKFDLHNHPVSQTPILKLLLCTVCNYPEEHNSIG